MTVADVLEYVRVVQDRQIAESKRQASMLFNTCGLMTKLLSAKAGQKIAIYDVYKYWSDDEIKAIKIEQYKNYFRQRSKQNTE